MQSVYARTIYRPSDILFNRRYQVRYRVPKPTSPIPLLHTCWQASSWLIVTHPRCSRPAHPPNESLWVPLLPADAH